MTTHSCYVLCSKRPGYYNSRRAYVGYNKNFLRRLEQHNGIVGGGPTRTAAGRPWEYVVLVSGFPTELSAKMFEWAWQNPRVKTGSPWVTRRLRREGLWGGAPMYNQLRVATQHLPDPPQVWVWRLRVLAIMLNIPEWAALNLRCVRERCVVACAGGRVCAVLSLFVCSSLCPSPFYPTPAHIVLPPHRYRVFFPCREYKDRALGYIVGPTPALVDAHVGPHQGWDVNDNDVVVL